MAKTTCGRDPNLKVNATVKISSVVTHRVYRYELNQCRNAQKSMLQGFTLMKILRNL